ncbi:Integrase zinc binding domain [Popillia japonica]|uniref:RNA-directed DNA polymerase n=1 Tax=Popillia japonica TaxID=7064 RepID=A0AAW1K2U3_POPJA
MDKWPSSDEDKKIKTFFTALGSSALTKYNRFQLTAEEQRNIDTVIEAIRKKLSSKKNVIYDRAMFNSCKKLKSKKNVIYDRAMFNSCNQDNDSFDEYLLKLQKLIAKCEFRDFETDLLRDRIVLGIINKDLRKRLMATSDLTLERAIDMCRNDEITNRRLLDIKDTDERVNKRHEFVKGKCPAYGKVCKINFGENIVISKTNHKLQGFGGSKIPLIGEIYLRCKVKNRKYGKTNHKLQGFGGSKIPLIGEIYLKYKNVDFYKRAAQNLIEKYETVFTGYGELPGEVNLEIDNSIEPVIQTAPENKNILPFAIKIYNQYKHELSIQDGIIYRGDQVPYKLRRTMIDKVHTSHNGINATLNLAKSNLLWPGMTNDIKNKIKECSICLKYSVNQQKVPMNSHEIPSIQNYKHKITTDVEERIEQKKRITKLNYDKNTRKLPDFKIGQPVVVQINPEQDRTWKKGKIEKQLNENSYIINRPRKEQTDFEEKVELKETEAERNTSYSKDQNKGTFINEETKGRPKRERKRPEKFKDYIAF